MSLQNLQDALEEMVKDLYNAEKQLVKALPRMARAASSEELKHAIEEHLTVTEGHVTRLEEVFSEMELPLRGKQCAGMEGLLEEGKEVLEKKGESNPAALDAALIAAAQKVEHYEMSAYGSARAFAEQLGLMNVAKLLQQTLDEESHANETLTKIASDSVNAAAASEEDTETVGAGRSAEPKRRNGRGRNSRNS